MKSTRQVQFSDLRRLLTNLGFVERTTESAVVFNHPKEGLVVFRRYADDESVSEGDVRSTRRFLDMRGLYASEDFDGFLEKATTPA